ncbi:MAG: hypothetical protein ACO3CU_09650, partial [Candidatus Nanopelagicales bacterium]
MADGAAAATGPIKPSGVRGSIASHAAMVAVALGIAQVASYAVSVIAARTLGPDGFGVLAALLAEKGYTGPENVFEAKDGVMQTFGEGADGHKIWQALANPWEYL